MPFETSSTAMGPVTLFEIVGTMTIGNQLQSLEWNIEELLKQGKNRIVFDLSRMTFLDSSAIGVLVGCTGSVRAAGGQLRISGITGRVESILKMTDVTKVLSIDETREAALAAAGAA